MNKQQYNKYISRIDPKKGSELERHKHLYNKYYDSITQMTNDLFENPEKPITTDVNESFDCYIKTLIDYFQMKELETNDKNEDTLFGNIEDEPNVLQPTPASQSSIMSFWGGKRILKK